MLVFIDLIINTTLNSIGEKGREERGGSLKLTESALLPASPETVTGLAIRKVIQKVIQTL